MGRLKWTPYTYYTSSPEEFYYACKGYFKDKEEDMMVQRKAAYAMVGGSLSDFNKFWPVNNQRGRDEFVLDIEMRDKILAAHPTIKRPNE